MSFYILLFLLINFKSLANNEPIDACDIDNVNSSIQEPITRPKVKHKTKSLDRKNFSASYVVDFTTSNSNDSSLIEIFESADNSRVPYAQKVEVSEGTYKTAIINVLAKVFLSCDKTKKDKPTITLPIEILLNDQQKTDLINSDKIKLEIPLEIAFLKQEESAKKTSIFCCCLCCYDIKHFFCNSCFDLYCVCFTISCMITLTGLFIYYNEAWLFIIFNM